MAGKPGRNDPCPCGSGKKYKKCCLDKRPVQTEEPPGKILQIKVSLQKVDPPIWRRLLVRGDTSLGLLHRIIQIAMGWYDAHLHEFIHKDSRYGPPDPDSFEPVIDEDTVRLDSLLKRKGSALAYQYDFGDSWMHRVELENKRDPQPGFDYPCCLEGERACPPEDCGGTYGYQDILAALARPKLKKHRELLEWVGGEYDPDHFDPHEVNDRLIHVERGYGEYELPTCGYDAEEDPDPEAWLDMDEIDQQLWVQAYHEAVKPHAPPPDPRLHASMHVVAETWLALGDPPEARAALERLTSQGLSRHDAVHAIASTLVNQVREMPRDRRPDIRSLSRDLAALTRESWEKYLAEEDR